MSTGMGLAGFDYDKLYNLAERRKIDLDSWKWFCNFFEMEMLKNERKSNG